MAVAGTFPGVIVHPFFHLCTKDYARLPGAVNRKLDERKFKPFAMTCT
jgi:hypothetical protein